MTTGLKGFELTDACILSDNLVAEFWYSVKAKTGYIRFVPDKESKQPITNSYGYTLPRWNNYKKRSTAKGFRGDEQDWDYEGEEKVAGTKEALENELLAAQRKLAHFQQDIPQCVYKVGSNSCIVCGKPESDEDEGQIIVFDEDGEWVESD